MSHVQVLMTPIPSLPFVMGGQPGEWAGVAAESKAGGWQAGPCPTGWNLHRQASGVGSAHATAPTTTSASGQGSHQLQHQKRCSVSSVSVAPPGQAQPLCSEPILLTFPGTAATRPLLIPLLPEAFPWGPSPAPRALPRLFRHKRVDPGNACSALGWTLQWWASSCLRAVCLAHWTPSLHRRKQAQRREAGGRIRIRTRSLAQAPWPPPATLLSLLPCPNTCDTLTLWLLLRVP